MPAPLVFYNAFMHIFVTGATGLLGSRVVGALLDAQHAVSIVTRNAERARKQFRVDSVEIIEADITKQGDWQNTASECHAIVHLAGAGIVDRRWTPSYKEVLRSSRIESTYNVAKVANKILICASATGYYGDCGDHQLTENSPVGKNFLSDLCNEWETTANNAKGRVVSLRFGIILDKRGGALAKMFPLFRFGLGGAVGNGRQYWPWIAWQDACQTILDALQHDWEGPINAVAPEQVTCKEFTRTLGKIMKRPSLMKAPSFALRLLIGEGSCVLTTSQRVIPCVLLDSGFQFEYPILQRWMETIETSF